MIFCIYSSLLLRIWRSKGRWDKPGMVLDAGGLVGWISTLGGQCSAQGWQADEWGCLWTHTLRMSSLHVGPCWATCLCLLDGDVGFEQFSSYKLIMVFFSEIKKWDWRKRQKELLRRSSLPSGQLSGRPQKSCLKKTQSWSYFYLLCVLLYLQHLSTVTHFLQSATWQAMLFFRGLSSLGRAINLLLVPSFSLWVLCTLLSDLCILCCFHTGVSLREEGWRTFHRYKAAVVTAPAGNLCSPSSASMTMAGAKLRSSFHLSKNPVQPQWMEGLQQFVLHYILTQCLDYYLCRQGNADMK